jgi:hypothetical protein
MICAAAIAMIGCNVKGNVNYDEVIAQNEQEKSVTEDTKPVVDDNIVTDNNSDVVTGDESDDKTNDEPEDDSKEETLEVTPSSDVDVDLTTMSSILVYSEVYNMVFYPENYIGKTVRMKGINSVYYDEAQAKYYFACFIMDATACCSQGIEYQLTEDYAIPDDYPDDNADVCVEGTFDTYMEGEYTYCVLRNAVLIK